MALPTFPILYWRDTDTKANDVTYDDLEKLLSLKPLQCLVFDNDDKQLEHVLEGGDDPVTNEPALTPTSTGITIYKQQGRSPVPTITLEGNCGIAEKTWRNQARTFSRKPQIETAFHKHGIIGLWFPDADDFDIEPTDVLGYTMALPVFEYYSPAEVIHFRFNLSLGMLNLT